MNPGLLLAIAGAHAVVVPSPTDASGTDLSFIVAVGAGLISFLSPCVLPLVPAYLAQLTAVAVAGGDPATRPSRWLALGNAAAYVAGFGLIFTLLGLTATFAGGPLVDVLPQLRTAGGLILIVMGLSLAGVIHIAALDRVWRPLDAGAAASLATTTGTLALAPAGGGGGGPSTLDRVGGRVVSQRGGFITSFGLGAIFAVGWTPCIGIILGGILAMAATSGTILQGGILLIGYTLGLGIPFLVLGFLYDRAPGILRPLIRHGRTVSFIGGMLVVAIGVAMVTGWLDLLPRYFSFNSQV